jgi:hypothetical protein
LSRFRHNNNIVISNSKDTSKAKESPHTLKKIFIYNYFQVWQFPIGRDGFIANKCPVDTCTLVGKENASDADAVLFVNLLPPSAKPWSRPLNQVAFFYKLTLLFKSKSKKYKIKQKAWK